MKKYLQVLLIFPLSSILLSGFIDKRIQKTINVTTKLAGDSFYLKKKDFFGITREDKIMQQCQNFSIDERTFNELLTKGVKVISVADPSWNIKVSFPNIIRDINSASDVWENFPAGTNGTCLGKKYVVEGKEKVINNYLKQVEQYDTNKEYFKNLKATINYVDFNDNKNSFSEEGNYRLRVLEDRNKNRKINILEFRNGTTYLVSLNKDSNSVYYFGSRTRTDINIFDGFFDKFNYSSKENGNTNIKISIENIGEQTWDLQYLDE